MKFEDMKKIWDEQNKAYLYAIDEEKLRQMITNKKKSGSRVVNKLEWTAMGSNLFAGSILIGVLFWDQFVLVDLILGIYMLSAAAYIYLRRVKRLRGEDNFERTMHGDLQHALANAKYQVNLSLMLLIYFIPVAGLVWFNLWSNDKPFWSLLAVGGFFVIVLLASLVEHQKCHVARKRKVEAMLNKLKEE